MEIMNIVKKKKKKGFTLIELIAVIAILAILGVILVPKVAGYSTKANAAKDLTNAKQLLQAVEMYNQDHQDAQIGSTVAAPVTLLTITKSELTPYTTWPSAVKTAKTFGTPPVTVAVDTVWDDMDYDTLKGYAEALQN